MPRKEVTYTWGEILDSFKRGVLGADDDFDDDDFEEVEEAESAEQADKKTEEPAKSNQESKPVSKSAQKPADQEADKDSNSVFCSSLQTDLNTFVQTGTASDTLLQLLKEGFSKNPDLLDQIARYIAIKRRGEERIHPGYLVSYKGEDLMFLSKEKALDHLLSNPGASVREAIFVSLVKDRKAVSTREASEEEKKLYFEQKSSKADTSGQECQDY